MALHKRNITQRTTRRRRPTLPSQASPKARAAVAKKRPRRARTAPVGRPTPVRRKTFKR